MPKDFKVQQKLGGLTKTASDHPRSWGHQLPWGGLGEAPLLLVAGWPAALPVGGVHAGRLGRISLAVPLSLA